ncbi:hypothetical protein ENBRE01_1274 [Enteropsectra breve]|nr:hypothetical protein ENBRE01_1274 [Enteropsectra breve]
MLEKNLQRKLLELIELKKYKECGALLPCELIYLKRLAACNFQLDTSIEDYDTSSKEESRAHDKAFQILIQIWLNNLLKCPFNFKACLSQEEFENLLNYTKENTGHALSKYENIALLANNMLNNGQEVLDMKKYEIMGVIFRVLDYFGILHQISIYNPNVATDGIEDHINTENIALSCLALKILANTANHKTAGGVFKTFVSKIMEADTQFSFVLCESIYTVIKYLDEEKVIDTLLSYISEGIFANEQIWINVLTVLSLMIVNKRSFKKEDNIQGDNCSAFIEQNDVKISKVIECDIKNYDTIEADIKISNAIEDDKKISNAIGDDKKISNAAEVAFSEKVSEKSADKANLDEILSLWRKLRSNIEISLFYDKEFIFSSQKLREVSIFVLWCLLQKIQFVEEGTVIKELACILDMLVVVSLFDSSLLCRRAAASSLIDFVMRFKINHRFIEVFADTVALIERHNLSLESVKRPENTLKIFLEHSNTARFKLYIVKKLDNPNEGIRLNAVMALKSVVDELCIERTDDINLLDSHLKIVAENEINVPDSIFTLEICDYSKHPKFEMLLRSYLSGCLKLDRKTLLSNIIKLGTARTIGINCKFSISGIINFVVKENIDDPSISAFKDELFAMINKNETTLIFNSGISDERIAKCYLNNLKKAQKVLETIRSARNAMLLGSLSESDRKELHMLIIPQLSNYSVGFDGDSGYYYRREAVLWLFVCMARHDHKNNNRQISKNISLLPDTSNSENDEKYAAIIRLMSDKSKKLRDEIVSLLLIFNYFDLYSGLEIFDYLKSKTEMLESEILGSLKAQPIRLFPFKRSICCEFITFIHDFFTFYKEEKLSMSTEEAYFTALERTISKSMNARWKNEFVQGLSNAYASGDTITRKIVGGIQERLAI